MDIIQVLHVMVCRWELASGVCSRWVGRGWTQYDKKVHGPLPSKDEVSTRSEPCADQLPDWGFTFIKLG